MANPYPRHTDNRAPKEPKESALPLGLWVTLYFREPIGGLLTAEGGIDYCSTYGVRLTTEDGLIIYASHANILGAVGAAR